MARHERLVEGEYRVEDFESYVAAVGDILPATIAGDGQYWFRGQSNAGWDLRPSFMRSSCGLGLSMESVADLEKMARKAFRSKAHLFVAPHLLDKVRTTPCWWALMQHHGAPTRLLDWTVSPFVAAYFAVQQDGTNNPGVVWCFCRRTLQARFDREGYGRLPDFEKPEAVEWYDRKLEELCDQPVVVPLSFNFASSERMVAQQGMFTMCFNVHQAHSCIFDQLGCSASRKIVIPHEAKAEILLRLRDMNITGASLFPGVDGLGMAIKELVSLGVHFSKAIM